MNILDENILEDQRRLHQNQRIRVRQIGYDLWHKGLKDDEIPRLLRQLRRPTFFTRDLGFYHPRFCDNSYSMVVLGIGQQEAAVFVRRVLRHAVFSIQAQRMSLILYVSHRNLRVWRRNSDREEIHGW